MAKVTRSVLKDLVKECLVEILAEGLANTKPGSELVARQPARTTPRPETRRKHPTNFMEVGAPAQQQPSPAIQERINHAAGADSVMRDILADTASRTLPHMMAADNKETSGMAERMTHGDAATKAMVATDPMDLFEGSSNWAALAFSDAKPSTNS